MRRYYVILIISYCINIIHDSFATIRVDLAVKGIIKILYGEWVKNKMRNQLYIKSAGTHIMCVMKSMCCLKDIKGAVILVPGFSQSSCDVDYFMTNLSNALNEKRYLTLQVDLYGHGDSYGDLSSINLQILRDNILSVIKYINNSRANMPIWGITRGIYGNLFCEDIIAYKLSGVICVNPVRINEKLQSYISHANGNIVEIRDFILENTFFEHLFMLMGAELTNIRGQKININFLDEIANKIEKLHHPKNVILLSSYNENKKISEMNYSDIKDKKIDYLSERCFLRDPEWQLELINKIVKVVRENENADAISNK